MEATSARALAELVGDLTTDRPPRWRSCPASWPRTATTPPEIGRAHV